MDSSSGSIKRKLDDRQPRGQSFASSNASHTPEGSRSNFDQIHESPTASPRQITNAMVTKKMRENEKAGNDFHEPLDLDFGYVSSADKMSLQAIAGGSVDKISAKMDSLTTASLEKTVEELRVILEGNGASQKWEYLMLQKLVQSRTDLTATTLSGAHKSQLKILVAINTGNRAFLHPITDLFPSKTSLIEIFEQKRCRNVEKCKTLLPAKNCVCRTCTNKKGFCNICMCIICNKYEFKENNCESCDMCSHKFHRDCAMGNGLIGKSKGHPSKMVFRCQDCSELIDLMIKSLDKALNWEALMNDFDMFSMILHGKDNPGQKELFWKCEDLKEKMKNGKRSSSITEIFMFFRELSMDAPKSLENGEEGKLIAALEASNQIAEVETKLIRDMPCSEGALVLEKEEEEKEHAIPETDVIGGGKTSGQTEIEAPNNPDNVRVEDVQPLEQPQQLVDADGAQPEPATRDAGPPSPNSSSNLRSSTLLRKFPPIPSNLPLHNVSNMDIPNLSFNGTYSSSKDTMRATTPDQPQILAEFFCTHPTVRTRIESFSEGFRNTFSKRLATLLHHLQSVKMRDFDEAAKAEVQEAWIDLTTAGFELQDLEPAVNLLALHAKMREREEELTTTMQALRDKLDNPPLYSSNNP